MTRSRSSLVDGIGLALTAAVFVYVVARAWAIGLTPDEATTYLIHARATWWDIITFVRPIQSNSHLLNTLLMKLSTRALGDSEVVIRLPALAGSMLYVLYTYRIVRRLVPSGHLFLVGLVLLLVNPFIIEFLALARGYALGLGFMMAGVYYLLPWLDDPGSKGAVRRLMAAFVLLAMAVLAVLPFFNVWAGLVPTMVLLGVLGVLGPSPRRALITLARAMSPGVIVLLIVLGLQVSELRRQHQFYYGGHHGFFRDTVGTLMESIAYRRPYLPPWFVEAGTYLASGMVVISGLAGIVLIVRRRSVQTARTLLLLTGTIVFAALAIVLQHAMFGTPYVIRRTAIYFVPLAFLQWLLLAACLVGNEMPTWIRRSTTSFAYIAAVAILAHGAQCFNLTHTEAWRETADARAAMQIVASRYEGRCQPPESVVIKVTWWFGTIADYYKERLGLGCLTVIDRKPLPENFDLMYVLRDELARVAHAPVRVIASFPLSKTQLAVRDQR